LERWKKRREEKLKEGEEERWLNADCVALKLCCQLLKNLQIYTEIFLATVVAQSRTKTRNRMKMQSSVVVLVLLTLDLVVFFYLMEGKNKI